MTRKALVIAVLTVIMGTHMTACSSSGGKDDTSVAESNDETFAEEGEGDFADNSAQASTDATAAPADGSLDAGTGDQAAAGGDATAKPEDAGGDLSLGDGAGADVAQNADANALPADAPPADGTGAPADVASTTEAPKAADDGGLSLDSADALPQDSAAENITQNPSTPSDAGVFDANKPADTTVADAGTPPADVPADVPADTTPAPEPVAEAKPQSSPKHASSGTVSYAPLMKVKEAPFTGPGGETLNRVYIARPKDTAKSIASKVYNDPKRSKDLVKWNPVLKRGARAGDKVYYASAANPSDSKMMNFYEEAGVAPQTYTSKDGDNLRTVAKSLLGFKDAWKEVWETNPSVDSKGKIPAGLSIAYWPESATAAPVQTMAAAASTTPDANGGMPTTLPEAAPQIPPQAQGQQAGQPPAGQPQAQAQANNAPPAGQQSDPFAAPPPGGDQAAAAGQPVAQNGQPQGVDPMAPPPPNAAAEQAQAQAMQAQNGAPPPAAAGTTGAAPPTDTNAAPPPAAQAQATKPKKKAAAAEASADEGGMDSDTTMALGVGGVLLLAAAILFVVIRKNRAKRMDLGQTQV